MMEGSEEACHALLAEIADHARHHAADELSRRAPLALAVQLGHPELPQRRRRRTQRRSDVGVSAEDPSKAVGRFASRIPPPRTAHWREPAPPSAGAGACASAARVLMPWRLHHGRARVAVTV